MLRRKLPAVKPTFSDRVVSYFWPEAGVRRHKARTMLAMTGGYTGGRKDRRATRKWRPEENSADADTLPDLPDLRSRSRDLVRNTPVATGAINTVVTSVVGEGLQVKPEIDREFLGLTEEGATAWEQAAQREWQLAKRTLDFTSAQSFDEMQPLLFRATLESGDVLIIRRFREDFGDTYGLKLQVIEADRLSNPEHSADGREINRNRVFGGVEINPDGRHAGYWVSNEHPGAIRPKGMVWRRVPARTRQGRPIVIHLYDRLRPDQSRGVPYLAPVIEALKQLGDYTEAEITAAVVSAMFTVFVTSDLDTEDGVLDTDDSKAAGVIDSDEEIAMGNGAVIDLAPGEKVDFANPSRPNTSFEPFMVAFLRQVGVALELPFELLIKHFTASFSASRAALETAWQFFRKRRGWLSNRLCQVAYEWVIEEAIMRGRLEAPGFFDDPLIRMAFCRAQWIGPARIQVDPVKEANADKIDIENRVKTRAQVIMERTGGTFDQKHEQLVKEKRRAEDDGLSTAPPQAPPPAAQPRDDDEDEDDDGDDLEDA